MRYFEIILETLLSVIDTADDKLRFGDAVWDILNKSYAKLGGFKSFDNKNHMITEPGMWLLILDDDENLMAAIVFKNLNGNKLIGLGTNGEVQGKNELINSLRNLKNKKNFWAEVSGPLEKLFDTLDFPKIENKYAKELTGKEIVNYDNDKYHYTRYIAGQPIRKIIVGYPEK